MTLLADKGAIRVGEKYQADVPASMECEDSRENGDGWGPFLLLQKKNVYLHFAAPNLFIQISICFKIAVFYKCIPEMNLW